MTLLPTIDEAACAAHGDCVEVAPSVFILEGDVAEVIGTGTDDVVLAAAEACPSVAIIVTDSQTGEQVYP
jgi:ferredoxin